MSRSLSGALAASFVALLVSPVAAAAQDTPADTLVVPADSVIVTALRGRDRLRDIPAATFVMSRDQLRREGAARLTSVLGTLPGFYAYRSSGAGDPGVVDPRGFTANGESSYLKLLVNGQDVRDVENGAVDWDWLFPDDVERLEVVEGPGAWAYGDGSEGGIVNLVRPELRDGLHSDCGFRAGSFGLASGSVLLSARRDPWSASLRGAGRHVDGWRARSAEDVWSSGVEILATPSSGQRLGVDALWLDADREEPGALTRDQILADREQAETETDFVHSRRLVAGLHWRATGARDAFSVDPYLRTEDNDQVRTIFFTPMAHPTDALTYGTELAWRRGVTLAGRPASFTLGGQVEDARIDTEYFDYDPATRSRGTLQTSGRGRRATWAGYAHAQAALDASTTLRLGVRGDAARVRFDDGLGAPSQDARTRSGLSPLVGLTRRIGAHATAYASFATAFRVPTLNQLFDPRPFFDPFSMTTIFISNPDLQPQRSESVELGGRWDGRGAQWMSLHLYSAWVRNEIDFDLATFRYANIGRSWHRGIQLAASQPLAPWLALEASGTWSPTTIREGGNDGNQINAVPEGTAFGRLRLAPVAAPWTVDAAVRYVGKQYLDKENLHALPDFGVLEAGGSVRLFDRVTAVLRGSNLLDRRYSDTGFIGAIGEERFVPAAGRRFLVGLTLD